MAFITGAEGACVIAGHNIKFNTWSATMSRQVLDLTRFEDTGKRRKLGLLDITGSASGHIQYNASNNDPGLGIISGTTALSGSAIGLTSSTAQGGTACAMSFTGVVNSVGIAYDVNNDATATLNFEISGGATSGITITWDES